MGEVNEGQMPQTSTLRTEVRQPNIAESIYNFCFFSGFHNDLNSDIDLDFPRIRYFSDPVNENLRQIATFDIDGRNRDRELSNQNYELKSATSKDDRDHYWRFHNKKYLTLIEKLAGELPFNLVNAKTAGIIALPAMNEKDLTKAIEAARSSYGENAESDLPVIIFHNYKGEQPEQYAKEAIEKAKEIENVHIIESRVPDFSTVALAKKILTDTILYQLGAENIPIIMIDADVVGLSSGLIQTIQQYIDIKRGIILAGSPGYDFLQDIKARNQVFGIVQDVRKEMDARIASQENFAKNTIGPFTYIRSSTLLKIGGLKPVIMRKGKLERVIFEDMQLSEDLRKAVGWGWHRESPVLNLAKTGRHFVYLDGERELEAFQRGLKDQWSNLSYYQEISGAPRPNGANNNDNKSPDNLERAMTSYFQSILTVPGNSLERANTYSKWIVEILERMGFTLNIEASNLYGNDQAQKSLQAGFPLEMTLQISEAFCKNGDTALSAVKNTMPWVIRKFLSIKKTESKNDNN